MPTSALGSLVRQGTINLVSSAPDDDGNRDLKNNMLASALGFVWVICADFVESLQQVVNDV